MNGNLAENAGLSQPALDQEGTPASTDELTTAPEFVTDNGALQFTKEFLDSGREDVDVVGSITSQVLAYVEEQGITSAAGSSDVQPVMDNLSPEQQLAFDKLYESWEVNCCRVETDPRSTYYTLVESLYGGLQDLFGEEWFKSNPLVRDID